MGSCLRCNATVNSEHPLLQALPPDADRPLCPTHGARCLALDLREGSRGWICSRGAQVLPCRTVRTPLPPANAEPGPANAPPISDLAWFRRGSPPPRTIPRPTHSLPLLHAAVGRLHPDALRAWESDPRYGALWSRTLANLRLAGSVPPHLRCACPTHPAAAFVRRRSACATPRSATPSQHEWWR